MLQKLHLIAGVCVRITLNTNNLKKPLDLNWSFKASTSKVKNAYFLFLSKKVNEKKYTLHWCTDCKAIVRQQQYQKDYDCRLDTKAIKRRDALRLMELWSTDKPITSSYWCWFQLWNMLKAQSACTTLLIIRCSSWSTFHF